MSAVMPDTHNEQIPATGSARVHVLHDGYAREEDGGDRVGSTVKLITDGDVAVVVDPGMVASREALLAALAAHDVAPAAATPVVFSHPHPGPTRAPQLFPPARSPDFCADSHADAWIA